MSTLELLTKTAAGKTAQATSNALEDSGMEEDVVMLGADNSSSAEPVAETPVEVIQTETEITPAQIKAMKLSEVNHLYVAAELDIPGWADLNLAKKKAALIALAEEPELEAPSPEAIAGAVEPAAVFTPKETSKEDADAAIADAQAAVAAMPTGKKIAKVPVADTGEDLIEQTASDIETVKDAQTAHKAVRELESNRDFSDFKMGGYLTLIQTKQWFGDHANFKAFVEAETSLEYRKAMYLISIYTSLVEANIPWSKVSGIGWTKLKELAGILTNDNVDDWAAKAKDVSTNQLIADIAAYKKSLDAGPTGSTPEITGDTNIVSTLTFKVHDNQKDVINAAIDKAMKEGNTDVKTVALEYMAHDYLASSGKKSSAAAPAPVTPTVAAEQIDAKAYFAALAKAAGPDGRMAMAESILEAFDAVFPEVTLDVHFPEDNS